MKPIAQTGLMPSPFFGAAFWIGFTSTTLAGERYVRRTRGVWDHR